MNNIDHLVLFGLTRQEATIYLTLFTQGELTGYETAKLTGISRSNAYSALAGLVDKGAAYVIEGSATKYIYVPIEEFCDNVLRNLASSKEKLIKNIPSRKIESEGYITISGEENILNKLKNLLESAKERVYLSVPKQIVKLIEMELESLVRKGIKIVLITNDDVKLPGIKTYITELEEGQIRLIVDSTNVLTGEIDGENSSCLYSSKKNLVDVFKEALRNEMKLIELTKGVTL